MIVLTVPTRLHRNRNYEHFRKPVSRGWSTHGSHSLPAGASPNSFWGAPSGSQLAALRCEPLFGREAAWTAGPRKEAVSTAP
ncbi:MAG: hypothetical protein CNCCGFBP_02028 [Fimbriimonadaceae bacterium]|nr:hypothetical protein [Fimbriimonadaceae bacterium]